MALKVVSRKYVRSKLPFRYLVSTHLWLFGRMFRPTGNCHRTFSTFPFLSLLSFFRRPTYSLHFAGGSWLGCWTKYCCSACRDRPTDFLCFSSHPFVKLCSIVRSD